MNVWTKLAIGLMAAYAASISIQGVMLLMGDEPLTFRQMTRPFIRAGMFFACAWYIPRKHKFMWWLGLLICVFYSGMAGWLAYVMFTSGFAASGGMMFFYSYVGASVMLAVAAIALVLGRRDIFDGKAA